MEAFLKFIGTLGFVFLSAILQGFVLVKLWGWFVVPQFGLAALSIPVALGLTLIISYLTSHYHGEDRRETSEKFGAAISKPLFALFIGWVYTFFL